MPLVNGKLRRMTHRLIIVMSVLGLLALLTLGGVSLISRFQRLGIDLTNISQPTATPAMQNNPLLAVLRDLPGTVGQHDPAMTPQDGATRLAAACAELEQQHGLVPGSLEQELTRFAEQLLARADTSGFVRANALFAVGKLAECEATALQAKDEALAGDKPAEDVIAALDLAGIAASGQHHFDRAICHWRTAAALTDPASNSSNWVFVQWRIAFALAADSRPHEAETVYRQLIAVQRRVLGEEHPDTLTCGLNLANALWVQGKDDEAEQEYRKVLASSERVLGEEHPDSLACRMGWANALSSQGKDAEAEKLIREVIAIQERVLGVEHPETLTSRLTLANTLDDQGNYAGAAQENRAALAALERVLGAEHPTTLVCRNNLALAMNDCGQHAEAEQEHRTVVAIRQRVLGEEHPDTLTSLTNVATTLRAQGKPAEAEQVNRAVLAIRERVLGAEHSDVFQSCLNLALCLEGQGKYPESLSFIKRAENGWRKICRPDAAKLKDAKEIRDRIEAAMNGSGTRA